MSLPEVVFTVDDVINRISSGKVTSIGIINGAGISVNSGIPDFRSKGGLYDTLRVGDLELCDKAKKLIEEDTSAIYSREVFELSPGAVYATKKPFLLGLHSGKWRPTAAHYCIRVLKDIGLLKRVYTTNIDGFEAAALSDPNLVVQLHGSSDAFCCHYCDVDINKEMFLKQLESNSPNLGVCPSCSKVGIRPKVVFYGESLDQSKLELFKQDCSEIDLLFVIGSSMTVAPVSELPLEARCWVPRVVLNRNPVGESVGFRYSRGRDVLLSTDCDLDFLDIINGIGKLSMLLAYKDEMSSISKENLDQYSDKPKPAPKPTSHRGTRVELLLTTIDDLKRVLKHSREASIEIPALGVELSSYITAGVGATIKSFVESHLTEVRNNMQMLMGGGTASGVTAFLTSLEKLLSPDGLPWRILVDDPNNEATITKRDTDDETVYRIIEYPLSAKEKRLLGIASDNE